MGAYGVDLECEGRSAVWPLLLRRGFEESPKAKCRETGCKPQVKRERTTTSGSLLLKPGAMPTPYR